MNNRKGIPCPWANQSFCVVLTIFVLAPVVRRQTCKQSTANRFPRNFTSAWFSPGRPLWLRRLTAHSVPLQRSTFDWTGCCLSAACHGVIHAVLPHYLFKKEQAACPFRGQQTESNLQLDYEVFKEHGGKQKMPLTFHGEKRGACTP